MSTDVKACRVRREWNPTSGLPGRQREQLMDFEHKKCRIGLLEADGRDREVRTL